MFQVTIKQKLKGHLASKAALIKLCIIQMVNYDMNTFRFYHEDSNLCGVFFYNPETKLRVECYLFYSGSYQDVADQLRDSQLIKQGISALP